MKFCKNRSSNRKLRSIIALFGLCNSCIFGKPRRKNSQLKLINHGALPIGRSSFLGSLAPHHQRGRLEGRLGAAFSGAAAICGAAITTTILVALRAAAEQPCPPQPPVLFGLVAVSARAHHVFKCFGTSLERLVTTFLGVFWHQRTTDNGSQRPGQQVDLEPRTRVALFISPL
jgi:hypothetical protein